LLQGAEEAQTPPQSLGRRGRAAQRSPPPGAHAGRPRLQVLVLPGNPGYCEFYVPFLAALHAELRGGAAVACASHLGHHCRAARPCGHVFGLAQQRAHAAALVRQAGAARGGAPVALVGHSLGARGACRLGSLEQVCSACRVGRCPGALGC